MRKAILATTLLTTLGLGATTTFVSTAAGICDGFETTDNCWVCLGAAECIDSEIDLFTDCTGGPNADLIIVKPFTGPGVVTGGGGDDTIIGADSPDTLCGEGGNDTIVGGAEPVVPPDFVSTGDELFGGSGDDDIFGQEGDDMLHGGAGTDRLFGGANPDTNVGGDDDDDPQDFDVCAEAQQNLNCESVLSRTP